MKPINNSDLAWLIVADYNQDNNIGFPDDLREDVLNPDGDQWRYECRHIGVGAIHEGMFVGGEYIGDYGVGKAYPTGVGSSYDPNIGVYPSSFVGGFHPIYD